MKRGSFPRPDRSQSSLARLLGSSRSSEIGLGQTSIHRDQMARGAWRLRTRQEEDSRGTVLGINRLMGQGSLGVEVRQQRAQFVIGSGIIERDFVFCQGCLYAIARKHGRPLDDRRGADAVDPDLGG